MAEGATHTSLVGQATVFRYWGATPPRIEARCIFCRIARGTSRPGVREQGSLLASTPRCACFADIAPAAAGHLLVVPREHIKNWAHFEPTDEHIALVREMKEVGLAEMRKAHPGHDVSHLRLGFIRPPWNSVHHVHMHVQTRPLRPDVGVLHRLGFSYSLFFITVDEVLADLERRRGRGSCL